MKWKPYLNAFVKEKIAQTSFMMTSSALLVGPQFRHPDKTETEANDARKERVFASKFLTRSILLKTSSFDLNGIIIGLASVTDKRRN